MQTPQQYIEKIRADNPHLNYLSDPEIYNHGKKDRKYKNIQVQPFAQAEAIQKYKQQTNK